MNPRLPWALFLALSAVIAAPAATFEGKVEMKVTSNGHPAQTMSYQLREGKMRMDVPMPGKQGGAAMIIDTAKRQMTIIMPAQKMYMTQSMPALAAPSESDGPSGPSAGAREIPSLTATSESEKILGYNCIKYIVQSKSDDTVTELWATDQLGNFGGFGGLGSGGPGGRMGMGPPPTLQGWEKALMGRGFFPLRVVGRDSKGKEKFRMEVMSVEKGSLPDSLFAPPDGYRELNLGNIMGGMMPH